jgi:hypothetical protein
VLCCQRGLGPASGSRPGITIVETAAPSGESFELLGWSGADHSRLNRESRLNLVPLSNGRFNARAWQSKSGIGSGRAYNEM